MNLLVSFLIAFTTISPVWPIGPNPLPGDPFVIVNKQTNEVAFIDDGIVLEVYKAATGKNAELTPEGMFTVTVKAINPYYRKKIFKAEHPIIRSVPVGLDLMPWIQTGEHMEFMVQTNRGRSDFIFRKDVSG